MPPRKISSVPNGQIEIEETLVTCSTCGSKISSTETNCPNCGNVRKLDYTPDEVTPTGNILKGEMHDRIKAGGDKCQACGSINWNYDKARNGFVCTQCGYGTGERTDYVLGGGWEETQPKYSPPNIYEDPNTFQDISDIPWKKIGIVGGGIVVFLLLAWLIISLFSTHEVSGRVTFVEWQRINHQEVYVIQNGEGFGLPSQATQIGEPEYKYTGRDRENIIATEQPLYYITSTPNPISTTFDTNHVDSTPEVTGYSYSLIDIETPGAITTKEERCTGIPTMMPGASESFEMCDNTYQEDSTWGKGNSPATPEYAPVVQVAQTSQPTIVYADTVDVAVTSLPTNVYGTPTPVYDYYYVYTYWDWVMVGEPMVLSGSDNNPIWPQGQVDEFHRVVNDSEYYRAVIVYDNGQEKVYEGSDPNIVYKYALGEEVTGYFSGLFNIFKGDNQ